MAWVIFITKVQNSIGKINAGLDHDPELIDKLIKAYLEAKRTGLTREELLAVFIHLEFQAPDFHRHPAIRRWLRKPGATADAKVIDAFRSRIAQ